ncbi:uncharacterized protein LOC144656295 isoform X1 [Oculina patagonica]
MELKILFITFLFLGACAGFSLPEEQEDAINEDETQELEEMNNDEAETDLEDPSKVRRPFCPKGKILRCFIVKHCYRKLRICSCVPFRRYGDEAESDNQVNDEMVETPEEFDEAEQDQELEDPSKRVPVPRPRCPKKFIRKCFLVKYGYRRLFICKCVRPCRYGDETENEDEAEEIKDMNNDEAETDLEDPSKFRRPFCPKGKSRRCFIVKHCYRKLRICSCVTFRRYGDEAESENQVNDEMVEAPEEFDEADQELEDPWRKVPVRPRCPKKFIRKCFSVKYGYRRLFICKCVRPCRYGDETENDH